MNRTSMLLSRSGPPDYELLENQVIRTVGLHDLVLANCIPGPNLDSQCLKPLDPSMTQLFTPMVALEASLFGAPQSPRQNRSSIVIELAPISFQRKPASSLTLSPV